MESLAERLCKLRKENGYSQEQLADALNVSRQAVSKWECGTASPDTENLIALAKLYDRSLDDIVFGVEKRATGTRDEACDEACDETRNGVRDETREKSPSEGNGAYGGRKEASEGDPEEKKTRTIVGMFAAMTVFACVIAYVLFGSIIGIWHTAWLIFFAIPIIPSLVESILKKDPSVFCFPLLAAAVYLFLGFRWGIWHPGWVIFFLIPLYYTVFKPRE